MLTALSWKLDLSISFLARVFFAIFRWKSSLSISYSDVEPQLSECRGSINNR